MKTKKVKIILIILILLISFTNCIYASSDKTITQQGKDFLDSGKGGKAVFNTNPVTTGFQDIAGLLVGIGIFIAVAVGIILGMKFMFSTAEGKAEISKLLTPYIVGIVIVVGALTIWKAAIEILDVY